MAMKPMEVLLDYHVPQREIAFLLDDVLRFDETMALPGYDHCDRDTVAAVVDALNLFVREHLAPCNKIGDTQGAQLVNGQVLAAPGFGSAYKAFCEDGWNALAMESEHGGQQLPFVLHALLREAMSGANMAFALIHELNFGVAEALIAYGSEAQQNLFCPQLTTGNWAGTMCLTEPHCGTDLGLIRSKAVKADDGTYRVTGNKIFITWGDHDMSENVVHLILARVEGAQPGPRGLSLFLAPKYMLDADGNTTDARNAITITGIEDKMGIHGSPTCAISFEDTKAELVGTEGKGLAAMFVMMNAARLSVGLQALGVAESALQVMTAYAHERLQGRGHGAPMNPDGPADPLVAHADVRRRLLLAQGEVEASRALAYYAASLMDKSHRSDDETTRAEAEAELSALTPVVKSFLSDLGSRVANEAVQMHGGHGFVKDTGVEQKVRDVRITAIYEGTNAVQARDLAMRKLRGDGGVVMGRFVDRLRALSSEVFSRLPDVGAALAGVADSLERSNAWMLKADEAAALGGATDYLENVGVSLTAWMAGRIALAADQGAGSESAEFYADRRDAARILLTRSSARAEYHEAAMKAWVPETVCRDDRRF